jgi:hypothetical protein
MVRVIYEQALEIVLRDFRSASAISMNKPHDTKKDMENFLTKKYKKL